MITNDPYGISNVIKPGHMPDPIEPVHTCDPQWVIDLCLECKIDNCYPWSDGCELKAARKREIKHRLETLDRDEKILYLLTHGWRNTECICEELGIGRAALSAAKKRLRERGAIP